MRHARLSRCSAALRFGRSLRAPSIGSKLGLLDTGLGATFAVPFMGKLVELGYVEGKNVVIERKSAEGNAELLADLRQTWCGNKSMSS